MTNPLEFVQSASIEVPETEVAAVQDNSIDIDHLPPGLITGRTLIDLSAVPSENVRTGISLSLLFASRVAANDPNATDVDSWLASYTNALANIGFGNLAPTRVNSRFSKINVSVHKALIPVLTVAFGGAAIGPVILAVLNNLETMNADSPWITLFEQESRKFSVTELHFAAATPRGLETEIKYVVARLDINIGGIQVLFFKINNSTAAYESLTTTMSANNSLMAVLESDLKARLAKLIKKYIWDANVGQDVG